MSNEETLEALAEIAELKQELDYQMKLGDNTRQLLKLTEAKLASQKQAAQELVNDIERVKEMIDNMWEKGNIDWSKTFGIKWDVVNNGLMATDRLAQYRKTLEGV